MYAGMSLLPILDLISDVALITVVYLPSGHWKSALVVWYIIYQSLRFITCYAPLHPKPSCQTLVLLYVPGMLLPNYPAIMKPAVVASTGAAPTEERAVDMEAADPSPLREDHVPQPATKFGPPGELIRKGTWLDTSTHDRRARDDLRRWMNEWREKYAQAEGAFRRLCVLIWFECMLFVRSHWYGPYFTVQASLVQARDAWNDDGTRLKKTPAEKNHEVIQGLALRVDGACATS